MSIGNKVARYASIYSFITVLGMMAFYFLHYLGNQIRYDLAQERFSETFPAGTIGNIPSTGIDYRTGIPNPWEYCAFSGMVLASAADDNHPFVAAILLRRLKKPVESDNCPELKDASRGGHPYSGPAKLRYWWGSKAIYAIVLNYLSVLEIHQWLRVVTYGAYSLLAGASLLLGWRVFLALVPVIVFGSLFSGIEYFADIANGIPYIWAILVPAILALLLRWECSTRWRELFCFAAGMVSAYFWNFDGHNFLALALIGLVAWLELSAEGKTLWSSIRHPFVCVSLFVSGFFVSILLHWIFGLCVVAATGLKEHYLLASGTGVPRILGRIFSPEIRDLAGRDIVTYWHLIRMSGDDAAAQLQLYSSVFALVSATLLVGIQMWCGKKRAFYGVLWILALMLMSGVHFVLPNDVHNRAARFMFLPLALCWSSLSLALMQIGERFASVLGCASFATFLSVPVHHRYIVSPSIISDAVEGAHLLISSNFDVYHKNGQLIYVRKHCEPHDISPAFFLHIDPVDKTDLPANRQQYNFDNLDFHFSRHGVGVIYGRTCASIVDLPAYDISKITTGQHSAADGVIWQGEIVIK